MLVNPLDVDPLAGAIVDVVMTTLFGRAFQAAEPSRAARFTWTECAAATTRAYRLALGE